MDTWRRMRDDLHTLAAADLLRSPPTIDSPCGPNIVLDGRRLVSLCSNDYLNLANDPAVRSAAVEAIGRWGVGAGASRLISGTMGPHAALEKRLAAFKRTEAAVVTSTGWMANHAAIGALAGRGDMILCDKLSHASIIDAARACGARVRTYRHRDTKRLRRLLETRRSGAGRCLIVTDSLFSMDGDLAPLAELVEIKTRFDALLLIDEAHATGVLGQGGRGAAELLGVEGRIDATVGTLSKALGALGGFVAGPAVLIETIRNRARAFIYTTAPPPAICAAAAKALEIVETQPERRRRLLGMADALRGRVREAGLETPDSQSQIIPIVLGRPGRALEAARRLLEAGFFVPAIRPPTVAPGSSRLRISVTSGHDPCELDRLAVTLGGILDDLSARGG